MRVILLDIDGVLNSEQYARKMEARHYQLGHTEPASPKRETTCDCFLLFKHVDREAVARLNRIIAGTSAKIVISSTWRKKFDLSELRTIFADHGLVGEIIDATPNAYKDPELQGVFAHVTRIFRGHEIDFWLQKHPEVDRFVILDDDSDMAMHKNRLVQTDCAEGLLDEHVDLAIRMLAWDGTSSPSPVDLEGDDAPPGSSWGIHCHENGCVETLTLSRTTTVQSSRDEDYQTLCPALDAAAVFLGWRVWSSGWWCPVHTVAKVLACARCLSPCPACSCVGGPRADSVVGTIIDVEETRP